jgi:hypothetical protein
VPTDLVQKANRGLGKHREGAAGAGHGAVP